MAGGGPMFKRIRNQFRELSARITFVGVSNDVPALMMGAMDVFVFPSRSEGLG